MPYIKQEQREKIDSHIDGLVKAINDVVPDYLWKLSKEAAYLELAGILNYCCTRLLIEVIPVRKYWAIALKSGVIRNIADEYYRRYASPYEDEKIIQNGDVYPVLDLRASNKIDEKS